MKISKNKLISVIKKHAFLKDAAAELGIHKTELYRLRLKHGLHIYSRDERAKATQASQRYSQRKTRRKVKPENVIKLFKKTKCRKTTAAILNISRPRVIQILISQGIREDVKPSSKTMTKKKIARLHQLLENGATYKQINKKMGISNSTILTYKNVL